MGKKFTEQELAVAEGKARAQGHAEGYEQALDDVYEKNASVPAPTPPQTFALKPGVTLTIEENWQGDPAMIIEGGGSRIYFDRDTMKTIYYVLSGTLIT